MICLAWNRPPAAACLTRTVAQHGRPLYLVVCLPDRSFPAFRPSENPSALEKALLQAVEAKLGCIQFNTANALGDILPGVHLWLMPPEAACRLGEHFPQPVQWQTEAVPQLPLPQLKPWFAPPKRHTPTRAIVIGAGIAGAATARALAQHGLPVTVLEAAAPAGAASGNRQGLLYAKISPHHTGQTELLLCGYGHTRRLLEDLLPARANWGGNGVLHLDHNDEETRRNQALAAQTHHAHLYRAVSAETASRLAGIPVAQSALYWPQGVWLNPPALVHALLDHPLIELYSHTAVCSTEYRNGTWQVETSGGRAFQGSHIVFCMGAHSPLAALPDVSALPYRLIRGQTDLAAATPYSAALRCALSAAGYISPAWQGVHCFGATFIQHDTGCEWRAGDAEANRLTLRKLDSTLAENLFSDGRNPNRPSETRCDRPAPLQGHAALRCDSPDHLPLAGALGDICAMQQAYAKLALDKNYRICTPCPYLPGAYINTAHGSRGLATAPVCAAAVAAGILGLPNPLPQRLRSALSPNRTVVRALIRGRPLLEKA
ncbi:FAD-dependent 5-carboxymethylaminomethyl-2-thiouridine(34) oxidoreductase MnmC [Neisseria musculi]|uniref:tRNA U-34 5-methylaminomethyl-2-thiouridine biosynthesis protein MnmC C-terminal domain n=1 Tax=Neisseria musculi TaxID=1815583 RepID=A0A7H1M9A2_9NEIS|nr:FAD-dependent 5-carboxymethylaminomethyl-2-thiouridine(34) oxidoreductase MnmC [Neisseria musculi]QNT58217.1 tRNA U-34 5-methylaminomethyl-2-thiouridine biosynthesis protein MnmC [Neisseria musculi]